MSPRRRKTPALGNLYRLPHPATFLHRVKGAKLKGQVLTEYANALTKLATSKGSQAVHRARREAMRAQEAA